MVKVVLFSLNNLLRKPDVSEKDWKLVSSIGRMNLSPFLI